MGWLEIIGAIITGIVIPLLGLWLKSLANQSAQKKLQEEQSTSDEALRVANQKKLQAGTIAINASIDAQQKARDAWAKGLK